MNTQKFLNDTLSMGELHDVNYISIMLLTKKKEKKNRLKREKWNALCVPCLDPNLNKSLKSYLGKTEYELLEYIKDLLVFLLGVLMVM